jgi:murein L,D-transpeptidase YcbB/YkuD
MRSARFERLLATTAVVLALGVTTSTDSAFANSGRAKVAAMSAPAKSAEPAKATEPAKSTEAAAPVDDLSPGKPGAARPAANEPAKPAATETAKPAPSDTTTASVPAGKAATTSASDTAIVDKLREQFAAGKYDRIFGGKKERVAVEAFYAKRDFAPLWITDGARNERGRAAAGYLATVDTEGLEPNDYPVPEFKAGAEPEALAEAEVRLTDSLLTFVRHAQTGRVHYSRISADIQYNLVRAEPAEVLAKLADAGNVGNELSAFNPQQPQYKALKAKLAEARGGKEVERKEPIPAGPVLKFGTVTTGKGKDKKTETVQMEDPRVPTLRQRLGVEGDATSQVYDKAVADAVSKFQKEHSIRADGQLTAATVDALNGPKRDRERDTDVIIANMERWRWMPRDLGKIHVMVNIPDYTLRLMRDEKVYWKTKVVVGKPSQATPITTAEMKFITVNPTWNVPPSIIQNEYLPVLAQDPTALERIGLKVEQNADGTVRIWQPPGDKNALGRIRFNFPNKFLVYQHDTPDKHLFAHEKRAYSHGCMRVENPLMYGEKLLSLVLPNENYTEERLRRMFGGGEVNINFPNFIPVHLTYQTAYVDDAGKLVIRDDIYGRDARLLAQLKGSDRKVADIPVERARTNYSAPVRVAPGTFGGPSGPSFFDRLFGAAPEPAQRQRPRRAAGDPRSNNIR